MKLAALIVFTLVACGPWSGLSAQNTPTGADTAQQRIDEVFTKPKITSDYFAASYLEHNSQAKVEGIVKDIKSQLGEYKSVKKSPEKNEPPFDDSWQHYTATFAKGIDEIYIHFDSTGKIDALTFRAPHPGGT